MKRRLKAALAIVLCLTVVFSSGWCLGAVSAAGATVEYYMDGGKKTGIKSVTTADGMLYYDIADGGLLANGAGNVPEFYIKALTAEYNGVSTAEMWATVASNIFEDAGAYAGYFSSTPTSTAFDTLFTQDTAKKGDFNLVEVLSSSSEFETGVANSLVDGYAHSTGLSYYSSLEAVEKQMAKSLITAANDSRLTEEFIIKAATGSEEGFDFLNSTTGKPVIAAIATSKENDPSDILSGPPYCYSSFGLAFYDFELIPFAAEGVEFVTAAEGYDTLEEASADNAPGVDYNSAVSSNAFVSYTTNPTRTATNASVSFTQSNSMSVSNSMQSTESHTYGESHGVQVSLGVSIPKLFTKIGGAYSYGTTTQDTVATAYGETKSITESTSNTSSAQVSLPAHTKVGISQVKNETEVILDYDCPVYITYKVAVFGMNGYALGMSPDNAESTMGGMCTTFGVGDSINGYTACDNLYKRAIQYVDMPSFEQDQNYFAKTATGTAPQAVDWESIIDTTQNNCDKSVRDCVEWLCGNVPLSAAGATLTMKQSGVETTLTGIEPLYNLAIVTAGATGAYSLAKGGSMDLLDVGTQGFNQHAVPYYGYRPLAGNWSVCDANGNAVANETGVTIERTNYTQIVTANEIGDYYLKYSIDEETYKDVHDSTKYITNDDLTSFPIIKICVTQTGENHNCEASEWKTTIPATCFMEGTQVKQCEICGIQMDVQQVEMLEHTPVKITTPATCTQDGCVSSACGICGAEISSETITATGHGDGIWKVDFEATADHEGQMTKYCSTCNAALETKSIEKHTHTEGHKKTLKDATCTTNGEIGIFCADCDVCYDVETVDKLGHDNGVWRVDFEATADHDGQMSRYCSRCDEVIETKAIEKHTHTLGYEKVITPATCTQAGEKGLYCADCDVCYKTETVPATGHDDGVWKVDFEATTDHDGQKTRYCTKCNQALESTTIEKHKHTFGYEQVVTPATCTADGVMGKFCAECNVCYETVAIPAKGHGEKIGTVTVQPTCTFDGQKTFYCADCGMQTGVEAVEATGHDDGVWKVDFEATADHDGQMTKYCSVCNTALESKAFQLHEHSYSSWKTNNDGTHSRDCYKCDFTESANCKYVTTKTDSTCTQGGHTTYVCSDCNHTYVDNYTDALGHSWSEWKECADDCCHERECTRDNCDATESQDHSWSEWVDNKDGKFFKNGTKTRTCSTCGTEETEEAKHTSTISRFFYPIYVFIGNFVHKIIYLISLNWLFPDLTISPKI